MTTITDTFLLVVFFGQQLQDSTEDRESSMHTSYIDRFGKNSGLLHAYAADNSPRASEIKPLYDVMNLQKTQTVLNVPFEGNLLTQFLPNIEITLADFVVPDSLKDWNIVKTDYNLAGIPSAYFDVVLSMAGIHHLDNDEQLQFLIATRRVLKTHGRLLMSEVKEDSRTSCFLDQFVGKYTGTGHTGNYLEEDFVSVAALAGYKTIKRETIVCPWVFANEDVLFNWMSKFFGLSNISKKNLLSQVEEILGLNKETEVLTVNWELDFIFAKS
jgi:SAM-dependent methyltransferase